jgi:hypothetical protein
LSGVPKSEGMAMAKSRGLRNTPVWVTMLLVVLGVALIGLSAVYYAEPARSLPSFLPGHLAASGHHHTTHALGCALLGAASFVAAWMSAGTRSVAR